MACLVLWSHHGNVWFKDIPDPSPGNCWFKVMPEFSLQCIHWVVIQDIALSDLLTPWPVAYGNGWIMVMLKPSLQCIHWVVIQDIALSGLPGLVESGRATFLQHTPLNWWLWCLNECAGLPETVGLAYTPVWSWWMVEYTNPALAQLKQTIICCLTYLWGPELLPGRHRLFWPLLVK